MSSLTIFPLEGIPEVRPGDDLAGLIAEAARGRTGRWRTATSSSSPRRSCPRPRTAWCRSTPTTRSSHKPLVEAESVRILRRRGDLIISETKHGFVCANAGIDLSNVERG